MLARIKNASMVGKKEVVMPHTKLNEGIAKVMLDNKYITAVETVMADKHKNLKLTLAYVGHESAIHEIKRISKPGVRIYQRSRDLKPVLSGMGIAIISTPKGVLSDKQAKSQKLGGEVLAELW